MCNKKTKIKKGECVSKWTDFTLLINTLMLKLNIFYLNNELAKFEME